MRAVVFYAPSFDALGGGEVWVNRIANGLADRGFDVMVIGKQVPSTPVAQQWHPSVRREFLVSVPPHAATPSRRRAVLSAAAGSRLGRTAAALLDQAVRGWRPRGTFTADIPPDAHDRLVLLLETPAYAEPPVVVCTDVYTGSHLANARAEGRTDTPYYVMHHNSFRSLNRGTARAYRDAAAAAEGLIALTEEDADLFARFGVLRTIAIHNPRPPLPEGEEGAPAGKIVTWLARMTAVKAGDVAIRAWARVAGRFPDWQLHLYGDGPEMPRLERLADRLGLAESVRFAGVTDRPDEVYARARINLLTSRFEGWALVIGEAAVHGVPTIAADNSPGVRLQIENEVDGLLVPVGDVRATAEALEELMGDDHRRRDLGAAASAHSARFDLAVILDRWEHLLRGQSGQ